MERTKQFTPDKGWAWVILVSGFLCNVIFDGIIFSFGIFYMEFLDYFQEGRGNTSWIGSVISGVYAIVGPVSSILANKFGCRVVTIAGSFITAAGFLLSTFSPNTVIMILTYGIMGGFFVPFMYLPDYARKHNISTTEGAFLLSIIGITNTVGRILCGWLSDKPWADPLKIYNAGLIIGGGVTICCPWLNSYALLATYAAIFGFCVAAYVSLCAIILIEFLGLDKLSNSFGLLNMFRGIATFIGAPVAGFLFDSTGDYELAFYVAGATIASAGVICLPLRVFRRCEGPRRAITQSYKKERAITLTDEELEELANIAAKEKSYNRYIGSLNSVISECVVTVNGDEKDASDKKQTRKLKDSSTKVQNDKDAVSNTKTVNITSF